MRHGSVGIAWEIQTRMAFTKFHRVGSFTALAICLSLLPAASAWSQNKKDASSAGSAKDEPLVAEDQIPQNRWRRYDEGPLKISDFLQEPASAEDADPKLAAMVFPDIRVEYRYKTLKQGNTVTLRPEGVQVWSAIDRKRSWFSRNAKPAQELLDHEQGHFDLFEIAALQLQQKIDNQLSGGKIQYTARSEQAALDKWSKELQTWVTEAVKDTNEISKQYDTLSSNGRESEPQAELRQLQKRTLKQLQMQKSNSR